MSNSNDPASRLDRRLCSPKVAMALALFPGLGLVYLGYPRRGLLHLLLVAAFVTLVDVHVHRSEPVLTLLLFFVLLHGFVDTYRRAILINQAFSGVESLPPPEGWGTATVGARVGAGLLLMVGGVLALLNVRFGLSFAWLIDWWPLIFVLLGAVLLVQALRDRAAALGSDHR
jgi:hypothetical protein